MKKKEKRKKNFRNPLQSANPPPQSTDNQPQTTIIANPQTHNHESHRAALNHELTDPSPANPANPKTYKPSKPTTTSPTAPRRPQPRAHRTITSKPATQQTRKPTNPTNPQTHNHQQTRNPDLTDPSPATQNRHTYQQPITRSGKKKKKTETQISPWGLTVGRSVQGGEQRERKRAERARGGWGRWDCRE